MSAADQLWYVYGAYAAAAAIAAGLVVWIWSDYRAQQRQLDQLEGGHGAPRDRE